ncbi:MAG TPA: polyphosphate kinase 2 family protein [Nitrososphaerales archaeon]|nr:polyphosphate kinase 2 family protein [Nitrososphaerales archaeon]
MTADSHIRRYRIHPGQKVRLDHWDPSDTSGFDGRKEDALKESEKLTRKMEQLQEMLYAEHKHKVLIVLQGMDTGGKDGTIRRVFDGVNPQGVRVAGFRVPTPEELNHDFLWRVHTQVPGNGEIVIFNRSHYEGVLVSRVHKLVPEKVWKARYQEINDFERSLCEEGTTILKFYLYIDKDEQKKRLQDRLDDPTKRWKFSVHDLPERKFWSEYMKAYRDALEKTSTRWAPWYVVPANHNWFRDVIISTVIVRTLEELDMHYPPGAKDLKSIVIK